MHLTEEPPVIPPEVFDDIGAPRELWAIISRALAKDRGQRYQTIDELANAVRALEGEAPRPVIQPQVPIAVTRQRTQWTGNLSVPTEDEAPPPRPRSKAPWIALGAAIAAGGAVAAVLASRGQPAAVTVADAGAGADATVDPDSAPIPAQVTLTFSSDPPGAEIYASRSREVVGQTPFEFVVPGSREPRRYTFRLAGHAAKMIELLPVENVTYKVVLTPIKGSTPAVEPVVEVVPQKARRQRPTPRPAVDGSDLPDAPFDATPDVGPTTRPEAPDTRPGTRTEVKPDRPEIKPETKPETPAGKPDPKPDTRPETKPDVKPDTKPDPEPDPEPGADDDTLEIKQFPPAAPASP
jgi:hypothetical protein